MTPESPGKPPDALHLAVNSAPPSARLAVVWHPRDETPPPVGPLRPTPLLWASDGTLVWLIFNGGEPIPPEAALVRWWTTALIPAPPGGG